MPAFLIQMLAGTSRQHLLSVLYKTKKKKWDYNNRVPQIDHGSFTRLVFLIYGVMSRECKTFYTELGKLIADEQLNETLPIT